MYAYERENIFNVQKREIERINPEAQRRLTHISQVAKRYRALKSGDIESFYKAIIPENQGFEDKADYLRKVDWLRSLYNKLPQPVVSQQEIRGQFFGGELRGELREELKEELKEEFIEDTSWKFLFKQPSEKILEFRDDAEKRIDQHIENHFLREALHSFLEESRRQTIDYGTFEAGILLHDIGYARSLGASHAEEGMRMLQDPAIQADLALDPSRDFNIISKMAGNHGIFSDIGSFYSPDSVLEFPLSTKIALAVINALDSTAKPLGSNGFHSMLFSRVIDRLKWFIEGGNFTISPHEKLRQLFGPINYVYLNDEDKAVLDEAVEKSGLAGSRGFNFLLEKALFNCWGLVKDIITPKITFARDYYTTIKDANNQYIYLPHLIAFFSIISEILDRVNNENPLTGDYITDVNDKKPLAGHCFIETDPALNYDDFNSRAAYLSYLRNDLDIIYHGSLMGTTQRAADGLISYMYGEEHMFGKQLFKVSRQKENIKITIGPEDYEHFEEYKKAMAVKKRVVHT